MVNKMSKKKSKKENSATETIEVVDKERDNESSSTQIVVTDKAKDQRAVDVIDAAILSDIPTELTNNLALLGKKLSSYLTYYSAASLTRLNTLNKFIANAEERLYNVNVDKLDIKELNSRYKEAKKAQAEIMTITRQVSQQAVEADNMARIDNIYNLLKSMSSETLEALQEALECSGEVSQ